MSSQHIRVAVVGNVDSGKSTLIGSLVSSSLDDGRGMARSAIMKHEHELKSGRTSTIGVNVLGIDDNYQTVLGSDYKDVVLKSNRLVSLMDLAGVSSKFEIHSREMILTPATTITYHNLLVLIYSKLLLFLI